MVPLLCHPSPGTESPEKLLPATRANVLPLAGVGEVPHGGVQGKVPVLRRLFLPLSCALPRSIPGSPRQATIPCQRDCDAAEGKLCHSLLGRPRRRRGHRLRHLTAGIPALSPASLSLLSSMFLCQPFCCSLELLWHMPEDTSAAEQPLTGLCLRHPSWWDAADQVLRWG